MADKVNLLPLSSETVVDFSEIESTTLHLKIGRCNANLFNEAKLFEQIVSGEYDLCRLRIPAEDEMASLKLSATGLPFSFSGSIRRYKTKITERPAGEYNHKNLKYEMYDGSQDELLKFMLVETWGDYPIGYYRSPLLNKLVDKETEIESVFRYYKKFNKNSDYPANSILFIRDGDNYVGFFALNVVGNNLESHIGGIARTYQKEGYFYDMLRFIKEHCVKNNLEHFIFGARNENAVVQRAFELEHFRSTGTENVFHIAALLTHSAVEPVTTDVKLKDWSADSISRELMKIAEPEMKKFAPFSDLHSFKLRIINKKNLHKNHRAVMTIPVKDKDELLAVLKLYDTDHRLNAIAYLHELG